MQRHHPISSKPLIGFPAAAGKPVTRATAIRVNAFLSGVKVMANDIAKMPLVLRETKIVNGYNRTSAAINEPLYTILKDIPNRWQTSYEMRWYLASQLIMNGNCYCQKITDQKGDVIELVPLNAWSMTVDWDYDAPLKNANGDQITTIDPLTGKKVPTLVYRYEDGNSRIRKFYAPDLWHCTALNIEGNGFEGAPIIALAKEALSVLIAAEETAGRNFANGLGMGGFISFPPDSDITETEAQNTVDRLKKDFSGSQNAGKFTIIPMGGKWEKMTFNAQESQLLESRKWNEEEVARVLGGAPLVTKLGLGSQNSTYASSVAFLDDYFNTTLLPYTTVIEQTITRDVIAPEDRGRLSAKHNADIILRGDPKTRAETNQIKINSFQMTPNQAFAVEDMDAVEGGDFLCGGTGTPVIFDIKNQRFFIPGQLQPMMTDDEQEQKKKNAPSPPVIHVGGEPDAEGTGQGTPPPAEPKKPSKAKARLEAIAKSLADRVMRKEAKSGADAKFTAEVLDIPISIAEEYVAKRSSMSDDEARASLLALALGDANEQ